MANLRPLIEQVRQGRIDRRTFLAGASALGLSLPAATTMLGSAAAAAPKAGGHFRVAATGGSASDTLNPETLIALHAFTVSGALRNNLTEVMPDGSLAGELAESWEATPDAKTWRFKLRKDITFHNGKSLDADDVIGSINLHRGEQTNSAVKALTEQVVDVRADGKDVVVMALENPNADWPYLLADFHFAIVPKGAEGMDTDSGQGTGAYVLERFEPGVTAEARKNPNYWKAGRGHFESTEILNIGDAAARNAALLSGDLEAIGRLDTKTVSRLAQSDDVHLLEVTGTSQVTMLMLTDTPPFDDVNVRLALKYSVDRAEIVQKVLSGHGQIGNDHPIAPVQRFYAADIPQREYDPDKARFHLKQAGLENLKVSLSASDGILDGSLAVAQLFRESAKKAGIDVEIVREPADGYWSNVWNKKPFCVSPWGGRPTADWIFSIQYARDAAWNDTNWDNEQFNKVLVEARGELDEERRREMYRELQLLVNEDGGAIVPAFNNLVDAASTKVQTPEKLGWNFSLDGARCVERWWFA